MNNLIIILQSILEAIGLAFFIVLFVIISLKMKWIDINFEVSNIKELRKLFDEIDPQIKNYLDEQIKIELDKRLKD